MAVPEDFQDILLRWEQKFQQEVISEKKKNNSHKVDVHPACMKTAFFFFFLNQPFCSEKLSAVLENAFRL